MMMSSSIATNLYPPPPPFVASTGLQVGNMGEGIEENNEDNEKPLIFEGVTEASPLEQQSVEVMRIPVAPSLLPPQPIKRDIFTSTKVPTVSSESVQHLPTNMLVDFLVHSANKDASSVEARPSFALTTSLPNEHLIQNPASKAVATVALSTGIGAVVCGLLGMVAIKLKGSTTAIAYAFGGGLGGVVGGVMGLLLGATVFGRMAEQQQEMQNKINLTKTRVLVEQLTPISLDPVNIKTKRKKKATPKTPPSE